MSDRGGGAVPFGVDTWPLCEAWERRGVVTFRDRLQVEAWAARAQLELELEIDRRFDRIADQLQLELERRRPAIE